MNPFCDPETGICIPSSLTDLQDIGNPRLAGKTEIVYIGDPMCSWCWGIAPSLLEVRDHFRKEEVAFRIVAGGLRPGGGDPWDDQMKDFLKEHWGHVAAKSGQPFGYALMDREEFEYDTEPSCRALVAARPLVGDDEMEFFHAIQEKFYVESQDPKEVSFYASICDQFGLNYSTFQERFESAEIKEETIKEFNLNRSWGVKAYPTVVLLHKNELHMIAQGYADFDEMKDRIDHTIKQVDQKTANA